MSLNNREIDLVLDELDLVSSRVDRIGQPDRYSLYWETYGKRGKEKIHIALHNRAVRLCRVEKKPELPPVPPRFAQLLTARLRGSRIISVSQPERERIVHMVFNSHNEVYNLWIRLWSGNPNIILTNQSNEIIDVLFRKKTQNEYPGYEYFPDFQLLKSRKSLQERKIRDYGGFESFNSFVNNFYNSENSADCFQLRKEKVISFLEKKLKTLESLRLKLVEKENEYSRHGQFRHYGDLTASYLHLIKKGDEELKAEDYHSGESISIPLKTDLNPADNRDLFYSRAKKFRKGFERVKDELKDTDKDILEIKGQIYQASQIDDFDKLEEIESRLQLEECKSSTQKKRGAVIGLQFVSGRFEILVGRNSRENDVLLRHYARGNDLWLHVRDYPGGFVIIKSQKGKSIPLETMLDGANLALLYSSMKKKDKADIHYTEVKNLRRQKGGTPGKVIVNNDRNIHISYDEKRIEILKNR